MYRLMKIEIFHEGQSVAGKAKFSIDFQAFFLGGGTLARSMLLLSFRHSL